MATVTSTKTTTVKANPIGTVAEQKAAGNVYNTMTGQRLDSTPTASSSTSVKANPVGTLEQQKAAGNIYNTLTGEKINYGTVVPTMPTSPTVPTNILDLKGNVVFPTKPIADINQSTGIINAANAQVQNLTLAQQKEQEEAKAQQLNTQKMEDIARIFESAPTSESIYAKALGESGKIQAQQKVNELTGQLNQIVAQGQALQQQVVGQGRGIPEAIIGGQQAQFARETAIQALPVQAQLSAAQGNLEMATENLNTLFKIRSDDAKRTYEYKTKIIDTFYDFADKQSQSKLADIKTRDEREYQEKIKNNDAIKQVAIEATKYGLPASSITKMYEAKTFNEALGVAAPFLAKANRELKSVGDNLYMWDKNTNKLTLVGGTGGTGGTGVISNPAYAGIVKTILGSGKFTKDQSAQVANAINNGEDPLSVIKNNAKGIMTSTEATKLGSFETAKGALMDLDLALKEYYANGGKSNIFKGNLEKTINKLGEVSDPKLVEISTRIQAVLQVYRNAVSGTAYSVQESKDIDSIFPGITKSEGLNTAILNGRKKAFDATIDTTYGNVLGQDTYQKLKELETVKNNIPKGALDDKSYVEKVLTSKNIRYDDLVNNTPKDQIPVIFNSTGEIGNISIDEYLLNKIKMPDGSYKSVADFTKI